MRYRYIGYNAQEGITQGEVVADSEAEAVLAVRERGCKLLGLRRQVCIPPWDELFPSLFHVSTGELVSFTRQLATLVGTGTSLVRSLELLARQTKNPTLRRHLTSIVKALNRGESLSSALSRHPQVFGQFFCRVVEVGEYTGKLDTSLREIAELLEYENRIRKKALGALMYPLAVLAMALVTTVVLFTVALPPLLEVLKQSGSEPPLATRVAMLLVEQGKERYPYLLIGIALLGVLGKLLLRFPSVRWGCHVMLLSLPVLGSLLLTADLARFSRLAAILLRAGVELPVAMELLAPRNMVLRRAFSEAGEGLMKGESLALGLGRHRIVPALLVQMVATGEETNSLPQTLSDAAEAYQQQMDEKLQALITILEPAATLGVALLIGFIAFSMFMPIYSGLNALK